MQTSILTSGFPNGYTTAFLAEVERSLEHRDTKVFVASDFHVRDRTV